MAKKKKEEPDYLMSIIILAIILKWILTPVCCHSQVQFTHFNDLTSFDKHRVVTTGISWTGTVIGYKATGKIWKGALIGFGASMAIGAGKEAYDMTGRGVPSWSDMGGNLMGSLVGTVAGSMCCGLAQHIREKKEVERAYKFYNPITF